MPSFGLLFAVVKSQILLSFMIFFSMVHLWVAFSGSRGFHCQPGKKLILEQESCWHWIGGIEGLCS